MCFRGSFCISSMAVIVCTRIQAQLHGILILDMFLSSRYLSELLAERHKITPFLPVLPNTYRLLNQGEFHCHNAFSCTQIETCIVFKNGYFSRWILFVVTGIRNDCNYGKWLSIYGVCNVDTCTWKLNLISGVRRSRYTSKSQILIYHMCFYLSCFL